MFVPALNNVGLAVAYAALALALLAIATAVRERSVKRRGVGERHRLTRRAFLVSATAASLVALAGFGRLARGPLPGIAARPSTTLSPRLAPGPEHPAQRGLWISTDELAALPTDVPEFERLRAVAGEAIREVDISDQDSPVPQQLTATAFVATRLGDTALRGRVRDAIASVIGTEDGSTGGHPERNRPLGIGRNLSGYVVAADVIDLAAFDPGTDGRFRAWIDDLRTKRVKGADSSLADSEPRDHSNWGAYISATMTAINLYLGDDAATRASADMLRGWLGDRAGRQDWDYDEARHDYSWQCHYPDVSQYVPVNPPGCERDGLVIDGIIPIDMQRGGGFQIPPVHTRYPRESLHGRTLQAEMLHRAGFESFEWADSALARIGGRLQALADEFESDWYEPEIGCYRIIARRTGVDLRLATPSAGRSIAGIDWTVP